MLAPRMIDATTSSRITERETLALDAHERQLVRLAIQAAESCTRPRWWLARYGALVSCSGAGAAELNKEYRQHRKRLADSVKSIRVSGAW